MTVQHSLDTMSGTTTFNPETKVSCPVPLRSLTDNHTMVFKRRGRSPKETTHKWRTTNRRKFDFEFVGKSVFRVKRVRFNDKPSVTRYEVETTKYRHEKSKTGNTKVYGDASNCPKGSEEDCQDAIDAAAPLRRALDEDGDDEGPVGEKTEEQLRKEAKSKLHPFTHRPKNPYCDVCNQAKMLAPYGRTVGGSKHVIARGFGDHIVADHVIPKNVDKGIEGQTSMLIIKDVYTQFRYVYPADSKSADSIVRAFQHFLRTVDDVGIVYTDNAPELIDAIEQLGYRHQTSVEYQQSTKAVVEREVRTILEGVRANIHQTNMPLSMWPHACRHHATALNAVKQLSGDDAPWSIRYRKDFEGLEVPFGCLVFFGKANLNRLEVSLHQTVRRESSGVPHSIRSCLEG